jgi:thiamine-phosphate pyrophosphorylase
VLRYAITSRLLFPGDDSQRQAALLHQAARWATDGIDFIQLREKDLPAADLADLARNILKTLRLNRSHTRLLINSRPDIAIATAAHGVHLAASPGELTPTQVRTLYASLHLPAPLLTRSCHTLIEVEAAREDRIDVILFAPVFGKTVSGEIVSPAQGLDRLRAACTAAPPTPIYALGGITPENAPACLEAGATGIAGIRLFHNL